MNRLSEASDVLWLPGVIGGVLFVLALRLVGVDVIALVRGWLL